MRAWRLRTPEGQTLYVTRVDELRRTPGSRQSTSRSVFKQGTLPGAETAGDESHKSAAPGHASESGGAHDCSLHDEFRRRLRALLDVGPKRPREIEEAMDLVPGQARKWLERAEQDGEVERVSGRPVKFALSRRPRA